MSVDFEALTAGIVMGLPDIRVCLLTTRDGLALGAIAVAAPTSLPGLILDRLEQLLPGSVTEEVKVVRARVEELSGEEPSHGDSTVGAPGAKEDGGRPPRPRSEPPDQDVDRFSLSREFSGLYGEEKG